MTMRVTATALPMLKTMMDAGRFVFMKMEYSPRPQPSRAGGAGSPLAKTSSRSVGESPHFGEGGGNLSAAPT